MTQTVKFYTPTLLSYIDLMSIGGSEKVGDETKLGVYCSGLKYSIALFLRNNIDINIRVFDTEYSDHHDRARDTMYTFHTYLKYDEQTEKEKELIQINKNVSAENFNSVHSEDLGGGDYPEEIIETGFSTKLGIDWELWMALREIFSNMVDEGGYYLDNAIQPNPKWGTVVTLSFEENSEFAEIWDNRHLYINEAEPLHIINHSIEALKNDEGYLRIYKQNILVYEDKKVPSKFAYNIKFGSIDEKRILSNLYVVASDITYAIKNTTNEAFLREIITPTQQFEKGCFLYDQSVYGDASDLILKIAFEVYEQFGEVHSYEWLMNAIRTRPDCNIDGKKIKSVGDHIYTYSSTVTVETNPTPFAEPEITVEDVVYIDPFAVEINKIYNFKLDVLVKKAKLKGSRCIADKFNKCIIIDEDFSIEEDFHKFLVEYIDLTQSGNVVTNLSRYICDLIRK